MPSDPIEFQSRSVAFASALSRLWRKITPCAVMMTIGEPGTLSSLIERPSAISVQARSALDAKTDSM